MNILILNVSAGFGHKSVSGSLENYIKKQSDIVKAVDILEYVNPTLNKLFQNYYIKSLKYIPDDIQSRIYEREIEDALKKNDDKKQRALEVLKNLGEDFSLSEVFNKILAGNKMQELFEKFQPDIVISTHPFIGELMDGIHKEEKPSFKLITLVTDYVVHPSWINQTSDYFIFPSEYLKYDLENINADMNKIKFLGLPIQEHFNGVISSDKRKGPFTFLIMGGGNGLGKIKKYVELLLSMKTQADVIVLCGNNKELKEELLLIQREKNCSNLHIYGFTEEVHKIMEKSHVLISKPGGVTLTEAMRMELPIVIKDFLPGQEERNTQFILNNHLGVYAGNDMDFMSCCRRLMEDDVFRQGIVENMRKTSKENTLSDIYAFLKTLKTEGEVCD